MKSNPRRMQGLTLLELMLLLGLVVLVVTVGGLSTQDCTGGTGCAKVACTETAPCTVNGRQYTIGNVCAAGVVGTVCKDITFFADCTCQNIIRPQGQIPAAICAK